MSAPKQFRFANVSGKEASGQWKVAFTARQAASRVYLNELALTKSQRDEVNFLYEIEAVNSASYDAESQDDQAKAATLLVENLLDNISLETYGTRWSKKWSSESGSKKGAGTNRVLYQCNCGYDHAEAGSKKRRHAYPFTGCLVHAEVTYLASDPNKVVSIKGYFLHNVGCKSAGITHLPARPVHPAVFTVALAQLRDGATWADISEKNRMLHRSRGYPGQPLELGQSIYRWVMEPHDTRSLYRMFNRSMGIPTHAPAHVNVHNWLTPNSPSFRPALAEAVFHYQARTEENTRFEICVATDEMCQAAWDYGHDSQILLDGTFGISDRKLLLFIVMGVDEKRKGVPLAFLLFSARAHAKQASASYDTEIITRLLTAWKSRVEQHRPGHEFKVRVAITDTDTVERNALVTVFPDIWLILCKFHVRQSWRNHRNNVLRGRSDLHIEMKNRMRRLEENLIHTLSHTDALALIDNELAMISAYRESPSATIEGREIMVAAESHLRDYLRDWWCREPLWQSWSDFGRAVAATRMGCAFAGVIPTTNHLESFNGVLKRRHLRRHQRGNRRLRLDTFISILVTQIISSIFAQRALERSEEQHLRTLVEQLPGGRELLEKRSQAHSTSTGQVLLPVAYLCQDAARDAAAEDIVTRRMISAPDPTTPLELERYEFTCYSSLASAYDKQPQTYRIMITYRGTATCTCMDFMTRGGACKHLRAALLLLRNIRLLNPGSRLPMVELPVREEDARQLQTKLLLETKTVSHDIIAIQAQADIAATDPTERAAAAAQELRDADELDTDDSQNRSGADSASSPDSIAGGADDEPELSERPIGSDGSWETASVGTDAPGDSELEEDLAIALRRARSLNRAGKAKDGIAAHTTARALFELENLAPKLESLTATLKSALTLNDEDSARIQRLRGVVSDFSAAMDRAVGPQASSSRQTAVASSSRTTIKSSTKWMSEVSDSEMTDGPAPPSSSASPPPGDSDPPRRKRKRRTPSNIIAPSPDKSSARRKQSFGIA